MMEEEAQPNEQPTLPPALTQRRILATSVRGDNVWQISLPALNWMIEHGDEELRLKALNTRAYWEAEQRWFVEWGNNSGYFAMAERACHDLADYKKAMKAIPADNSSMDLIRQIALYCGEQFNKPIGMGKPKNIVAMWKRKRKQSRGKQR